jgi:hypothetical protein
VLDALAAVVDEVFLDLALVVGALVDRDADLAAGLVIAFDFRPVSLPSMSK